MAIAQLLNVSEKIPTTQLTAAITRTTPATGADLVTVVDTIDFPSGANYIKINNTEKLKYANIVTDKNAVKFQNITRGVLADFLIGFFCGEGIDPRVNIPQLQATVGASKPIYNVINYQSAEETGMSSYAWYPWLYEHGMYLQLAFEPHDADRAFDQQSDWALDTIVAGDHDTDFTRWAQSIKAFCETDGYIVYLRPMSEMNGDWVTWGRDVYAGNTPANYRAAWQRIHGIFAAEGANPYVKWIWCPVADLSAADATSTWTDFYPGNSYVDIIGMNGYNFGNVSWSFWRSFEEIYTYSYNEFKDNTTKDLYICEIGCNYLGGNKAEWIKDAFMQLRTNYPRIVAATWFNMKEPTDSTINYKFNENAITSAAFAANAFFRRNCGWCGTTNCIHRVNHADDSPILGLGANPPDTVPITEKVATISWDGDILTNVPINGQLWMYFENKSYVEENVWVQLKTPKPVTSQDIYDGDILRYNLSHLVK